VGAAGAVAGVAIQRRNAHRLAHDPEYARLIAPLGGRPIPVVSADGTRLHAEVYGPPAGPTVVLAHGWTEQLSFWGAVIRLLSARDVRVVAYDLRGHGASDPGAGHDYALRRFGEDVEAVLAACTGEAERATVVGHSLGAMSIAAWAEHHDVGARACAAALVNTGLGDLIKGHHLFGELAKRVDSPLATRLTLGSRARLPPFSSPVQTAVIRYAAFGPTATAAQVAFYERMLVACPPDVRAACGEAMSEMDLWDAVARLTVPTLVVAGANDRLTPGAHARRIAEALPALAGLIELPETGHMLPLERPDELSAALAGLVADAAPLADRAAS
jgi:pimeloyl-ACP methyl ester carboxylesterase